ncbi:8-amino-7-oxononanoate synthase [Ochrobactrum soli]|uniref:8-amino-7-oxononanoate synthase n=1 Tax=Ochrobactrum TaxID=528 RepID=UPI000EF19935|nr:8-amino-7-oxononanoate synthase [[Ochrobactrum] soli]MCI1000653.1 8-amino-7-oxononanoate synthase [Ochrobactrum sp. C6C9]RLL74083.1 8-amino-7-oxononanoate synthase [[Ochrobactrum] soli]
MSIPALARYQATLEGLERKSRLRTLSPQKGVDFTSNDYLGLANSPRLKAAIAAALYRGVPAGAGGSRLLRGNHVEHEALESEAAAFFGTEKVLYFGTGFAANTALFATLPQRGDLIVCDALIHASAHEGISSSKADAVFVQHNDVDAFDTAINGWRRKGGKGHPWIAVESLYSMDGDLGPIAELAALSTRHDGFLVIDEAHATGIYGSQGRGLAADLENRDNVLVLHTCGKALGLSGALLQLPAILGDYLVNRARNFIYSTAPSPLMAAGVREALRMIADEPKRRQQLQTLTGHAGSLVVSLLGLTPSGSQIMPILIGDNFRAMRIAEAMRADGFDIRAIRPPTVPEGTARLRLSITLNANESQITEMFERLSIAIGKDRP